MALLHVSLSSLSSNLRTVSLVSLSTVACLDSQVGEIGLKRFAGLLFSGVEFVSLHGYVRFGVADCCECFL